MKKAFIEKLLPLHKARFTCQRFSKGTSYCLSLSTESKQSYAHHTKHRASISKFSISATEAV